MKLPASWKTSATGIIGLIVLIGNVANMLLDDNPATNPDWSLVIPALLAGIGSLFAKDYNATNSPLPMPTAETVTPKP